MFPSVWTSTGPWWWTGTSGGNTSCCTQPRTWERLSATGNTPRYRTHADTLCRQIQNVAAVGRTDHVRRQDVMDFLCSPYFGSSFIHCHRIWVAPLHPVSPQLAPPVQKWRCHRLLFVFSPCTTHNSPCHEKKNPWHSLSECFTIFPALQIYGVLQNKNQIVLQSVIINVSQL